MLIFQLEKAKQYITKKQETEAVLERRKRRKEKHEEKLKVLVKYSMATEWNENDQQNALKKLSRVAFYFDKDKHLTLHVGQTSFFETIVRFRFYRSGIPEWGTDEFRPI